MRMEELLEHADYLLSVASRKCDSPEDAQDLVQTTLLEGLLAIRRGKKIDNAKNWLVTVLNRRYYDLLREKYRKPLLFYGMDYDLVRGEEGEPEADTVRSHGDRWEQGLIQEDDLTEEENLRRLIANATRQYREVLIRHYFRGQGIAEIARALEIPENTVKSRLRLGRDKLRKDFTMEKYEKQSFEPENLWISSTGTPGLQDEPFSLVGDDKIAMNLLILAYEKPVTLPELADAIGISTTYVEPIVERLVNGELMKRMGDKVFTDFIIYTEKDRIESLELQKELAARQRDVIWKIIEEGLNWLRRTEYYKRQNASARLKLEGYFAFRSVYQSVLRARDGMAGKMAISDFPDRKNGGRWYAMGNRYPADYDEEKCPYKIYNVSGEAGGYLQGFLGAKSVGMYDYDMDERVLGKTHRAYHFAGSFEEARECVMKLLYAVYRDDEKLLAGLPNKTLEQVETFIQLDFLERTPEGKLSLNVPVLNEKERKDFYGRMNDYAEKLETSFSEEYARMIQNPVTLPKHLRSDVPEFLRYLNTCCYFPSAWILEARNAGLFLKDFDKPVPAVLMVVEE